MRFDVCPANYIDLKRNVWSTSWEVLVILPLMKMSEVNGGQRGAALNPLQSKETFQKGINIFRIGQQRLI